MDIFPGVYFCEDVSRIEIRGGLFYLTDRSGETEITRAMEPKTFSRCVRKAYVLLCEFESGQGLNVFDMDSPHDH